MEVLAPQALTSRLAPLAADTACFARAESHMQTGVICPSLALLTHSALLADTTCFVHTESHTQTGVICPSLALLAHSAVYQSTSHVGPQFSPLCPPGAPPGG